MAEMGRTGFVLSGILLTTLNLYLLNIMHGTRWLANGIITKDRALTVISACKCRFSRLAMRKWVLI